MKEILLGFLLLNLGCGAKSSVNAKIASSDTIITSPKQGELKMKLVNTYEFKIQVNGSPKEFGYYEPKQGGIPDGISSILILDSNNLLVLDNSNRNLKKLNISTGSIDQVSNRLSKKPTDVWLFGKHILLPIDNDSFIYVLDMNLVLKDSINTGRHGQKQLYRRENENLFISYIDNVLKSTNNGYNHEIELIKVNDHNKVTYTTKNVTTDELDVKKLNGYDVVINGKTIMYNEINYTFDGDIRLTNNYNDSKAFDINNNIACSYDKKDNNYFVHVYRLEQY